MTRRPILLSLAFASLLALPAMAQDDAQRYDRLKSLLENKFAPSEDTRSLGATRSLAPSAAPEGGSEADKKKRKDTLQWVKPRKRTPKPADKADNGRKSGTTPESQPQPQPTTTPQKSGSTSWLSNIVASWTGRVTGSIEKAREPVAGEAALSADAAARVGEVRSIAPRAGQPSAPEGATRLAQGAPGGATEESPVPVAKSNSFIIQLKPDATEDEIARLLQKYGLNVKKVIGALGVITVEMASPPEEGGTRSLAPEPQSPKEALQKILEPEVIKELRSEPIVDSAIVNSTVQTKSLRRGTGARVQFRGGTVDWKWAPPDQTLDGNWGLKSMRIPPVWAILDRYRKSHPNDVHPKIGIIDNGFVTSDAVPFQRPPDRPAVVTLRPDCNSHHAMHVAGIIGAARGDGPGIDGIVPGARIDPIAITGTDVGEAGDLGLGVENLWQVQTLMFDDVLGLTMNYLVDNLEHPDNLRVINVSLGYNFVAKNLLETDDINEVDGLKLHIYNQATMIRTMANRVADKVLFVVAAGNDSEDRDVPLDARWSSPFAWAGTYEGVNVKPARNILVVEAVDRTGKRARFSNTGGHVAAPGVDIMSTLGTETNPYAVCEGTSQAAPHAAALAAILFELDPTKKPAEVIDILKTSGRLSPEGSGAPIIDAFEAVQKLSPSVAALVADLDGDGAVTKKDLGVFKQQHDAIIKAATTETPFTEDLNGDGVVDDNECQWPLIDLNGSGAGSLDAPDMKKLSGLYRSDIQVMLSVWPEAEGKFKTALADTGLPASSADAIITSENAEAAPPSKCLRRDAVADNTIVATANGGVSSPGTEAAGGEPAPSGAAPAPEEGGTRGLGVAPPAPGPSTEVAEGTGTPESMPSAAPEAIRAEVEDAVKDIKRANPQMRYTINPATGLPTSISGLAPTPDTSALGSARGGEPTEEDTQRAVDTFLKGGLSAAFPTRNKKAQTKYVERRKDPDFPDRYIATVEQRVGDIPVYGSTAKLTVDRLAGVTKYAGTLSAVAIDDTTPAVTEIAAAEKAREKLLELLSGASGPGGPTPLGANPRTAEASARLIIFDPALIERKPGGTTRLAWVVSIDTYRIFVDAKTGEVFHYYRDQPTGMLRRIFDLNRGASFPGSKVLDEESREIAEAMPADAGTAFRNAGDVRDFFYFLFGRDGYDDNDGAGPNGGTTLESYVRFSSLSNAYWCQAKGNGCPKPNVMVYGPGYAGAVDIVAHEMTHGIIAHEAKLFYHDESGAVNEAFADIFGSLVELYVNVPRGNWVIGETLPGFTEAFPMRSMSNPNLSDVEGNPMFDRTQPYSLSNRGQPDNYGAVLRREDPLCARTRMQDNGCVHFNSGILNKFAYLISEGGEHRGVKVTGIGRTKLSRLAYRTLTAQLNPNSGLIEAADGFLLSCLELAQSGKNLFTASDCEQVKAAQQAVGLNFGS